MKRRYFISGGTLTVRCIGRKSDANCGALAVRARLDRHGSLQRACPLVDRVEAPATALAGTIVHDHGLDRAAVDRADSDADSSWWPAANSLVDRFADDLVERNLRALRERLARRNVEIHLDPVRECNLVGERLHGRREALVAKDDRLQREREVAQLADRLSLTLERH